MSDRVGCLRDDVGLPCNCPDIRECGQSYPVCGYGSCVRNHDALVALIEQHRYTLYDDDGLACECRDIPKGESYAEHLAKLIENLT